MSSNDNDNVTALPGVYRPDRHGVVGTEPDFEELTSVHPPPFLDDIAQEVWREVSPQLLDADVMKRPDLLQLAAYCDSVSMWRKTNKELELNGGVSVSTADGGFKSHPAVAARTQALQQMLKFGQEFGLTPSSRNSLRKAPGGKKESASRHDKATKARSLLKPG